MRVSKSSKVLVTLPEEGGRHNAEVLFLVLFEAAHKLTDMIHFKTCYIAISGRKRGTINLGLHAAACTQDKVFRILHSQLHYSPDGCHVVAEGIQGLKGLRWGEVGDF